VTNIDNNSAVRRCLDFELRVLLVKERRRKRLIVDVYVEQELTFRKATVM